MSIYPTTQTVVASNNVTFHCLVTTDHEEMLSVQIYWRRDGRRLVVTDRCTHRCLVTTVDGHNSTLFIANVTVADSGQYVCLAQSSVDEAVDTASLVVKGLFLCFVFIANHSHFLFCINKVAAATTIAVILLSSGCSFCSVVP